MWKRGKNKRKRALYKSAFPRYERADNVKYDLITSAVYPIKKIKKYYLLRVLFANALYNIILL